MSFRCLWDLENLNEVEDFPVLDRDRVQGYQLSCALWCIRVTYRSWLKLHIPSIPTPESLNQWNFFVMVADTQQIRLLMYCM